MLDDSRRQAILERIRPIPIVQTLRMCIDALDVGYCRAVVPRNPELVGMYKSVHGGILLTIADSIACFAIFTQTGVEQALTTTDMNIRFLAPCWTDVTAEARVITVKTRKAQ